MTPDPDTLESIEMVTALLNDTKDDWWLIGGAAFLTYGIGPGKLNDIDVLVSSRDAAWIAHSLGLQAIREGGSPLFRSTKLYQWYGPPVPVEFMVELEVQKDGKWYQISPKTRDMVTIGNCTVFVPSQAELKDIARLFGRPKDLHRVQQMQKQSEVTS